MSTYTAPTITDASPLSASEINTALGHGSTGLGEAINGAVDINNISSGSILKAKHFQPGAVTRVWVAESYPGDFETLSLALSGEPFGENTNVYTPADTAVRFTTHAQADVVISAFIDLMKFKHEWGSSTSFDVSVTATLYINDTGLRGVTTTWGVLTGIVHRSLPLRIDGFSASVPAGTYDAWLRLAFTVSGTGGTPPELVQCYSLGRGIRVEAFYK
jgi:hypothetical protein